MNTDHVALNLRQNSLKEIFVACIQGFHYSICLTGPETKKFAVISLSICFFMLLHVMYSEYSVNRCCWQKSNKTVFKFYFMESLFFLSFPSFCKCFTAGIRFDLRLAMKNRLEQIRDLKKERAQSSLGYISMGCSTQCSESFQTTTSCKKGFEYQQS